MKIKVDDGSMSVILKVEYSRLPGDDGWSASPTGIIGADKGRWVRMDEVVGGYPIVFYGTKLSDEILIFEGVTRNLFGNPFHLGQTGYGQHISAGGVMTNPAMISWEVLSM